MSKPKKRHARRYGAIMSRSDIPFAQRMAMQHHSDIAVNREQAAKIAMFCVSVAMHELEGIGYKRLVKFSIEFMNNIHEFYEDPDVGMDRTKRRLEQNGIQISGKFFIAPRQEGQRQRQWEIDNNRLQASQIALLCCTVTMNDVFGFGRERLERITARGRQLSERYVKEGEQFLLDKMEEIGFPVVNGKVIAYMDDDGSPVMPSRARKEGYPDA
jgi:hypothetical protein